MVIKCREAINSFLEKRIIKPKKKKYLPPKGGSVNKRRTQVTSEATGIFQVRQNIQQLNLQKCNLKCENPFLIFSIRHSASASQIY